MNDQAARIAKVRHVAKDLEVVDQLDAGLIAALDRKGEQAARAFGTDFFDAVKVLAALQTSIGDIVDAGVVL